ncbi:MULTISPECIES: hypothetical protein [unclassified Paenibacillus]|uniref:hypothetical protein n=1 Tax=unclassified Paenibacillus TaxID=185978 RepID=UPI0030FB76DB
MSDKVPGFPDKSDFDQSKLHEATASWDFHRDPGTGGKNYGEDLKAPNGTVVVDFNTHIDADHNTKGGADIHAYIEDNGMYRIPRGVHVGHRLTPGSIGGPGASYKGEITMTVVSDADWWPVATEGPHKLINYNKIKIQSCSMAGFLARS